LLVALDRRLKEGARSRSLFTVGYVYGFVFYLIGTHWIALLTPVAITVPWLKYPAWWAAAFYLAFYAGFGAWLAAWLARRSKTSLAVTFPIVMLAVEELRASGELGFPWFQPGYTQAAYPPIVQLASLGSVSLVTAWLYVVNVLVWRSLDGGLARPRVRPLPAAGAALALLLPLAWGQQVLRVASHDQGPVVALIQGNIPGEIKWAGTHQQAILDTFVVRTEQAAAATPRPILAIWPETATGTYLRRQLDQAITVAQLAARTGVPIFSGFPDARVDSLGTIRSINAAGLFAVDGSLGSVYAKRHLVPFGERMPFQAWLPMLGKLDLGQAEWAAGDSSVLFPSAAGPFSCLICFEAIFPDLAREDVRAGARWLVNVTNDEWFGNSAALHEHASMALFRAAENRVPLARCANTGITLVADAYGRIVRRLPAFETSVLVVPLPLPARPSWYARLGDWPGLLTWVGLAWLSWRAWRSRARRSR
jgi:apolipoprotein N-acyltransferase